MSIYLKGLPKISKYSQSFPNFSKTSQQLPTIPIKEKYEPEILNFTRDEFIDYLESNKEALKDYTTYKLNKMFDIEGYRITRVKGEIGLIAKKEEFQEHEPKIESGLEAKIDILISKIDTILSILQSPYPPQ